MDTVGNDASSAAVAANVDALVAKMQELAMHIYCCRQQMFQMQRECHALIGTYPRMSVGGAPVSDSGDEVNECDEEVEDTRHVEEVHEELETNASSVYGEEVD